MTQNSVLWVKYDASDGVVCFAYHTNGIVIMLLWLDVVSCPSVWWCSVFSGKSLLWVVNDLKMLRTLFIIWISKHSQTEGQMDEYNVTE